MDRAGSPNEAMRTSHTPDAGRPHRGAYGYVNGRPTLFVDPLGLFWRELGEVAAGGADTLTLGISTRVVQASGVDLNTDSYYFKGGQVAGAFVGPGGVGAFVARRAAQKGLGLAARVGVGAVTGGTTAIGACAIRGAVSGDGCSGRDALIQGTAGAIGGSIFGAFTRGCSVAGVDDAANVVPRFIVDSAGVAIDRASVRATISLQRQARHIVGTPQYNGGGYFTSAGAAQGVLDAFHDGSASVLGVTKSGNIVVRVPSISGVNVNRAAGHVRQQTNVFFIKGSSNPSVVPANPNWSP
jgi:hypothetical protein